MTLILKLDIDMVKMYLHPKNEVPMSRGSKVIALTDRKTQIDRQTDRQKDTTENITYPHTRLVISVCTTAPQLSQAWVERHQIFRP